MRDAVRWSDLDEVPDHAPPTLEPHAALAMAVLQRAVNDARPSQARWVSPDERRHAREFVTQRSPLLDYWTALAGVNVHTFIALAQRRWIGVVPRPARRQVEPRLTEKRCVTCGALKPVDDFYRHPANADGRQGRCKPCKQAYMRTWRAHHRERPRPRAKLWTATGWTTA